ncbi:acyl carrier protein [Micromonospora eburnea]|uniref:Acyl carrier protein n=1 Tax=Micromonospora eburnea TaxID=227316 RepID=A0A1C6UVK3_9ACTN|nr:acyl carrier protein [Micromonospora eburnea]SCL57839.1 Acyl carrier protein [Micromonospora eburnea]
MTIIDGTTLAGTDLRELITSIYRETLADGGLDADSDFFEAGGDSLAAFQITAGIEAALGVEVPVALVFSYPTPAELAEVVSADAASGV